MDSRRSSVSQSYNSLPLRAVEKEEINWDRLVSLITPIISLYQSQLERHSQLPLILLSALPRAIFCMEACLNRLPQRLTQCHGTALSSGDTLGMIHEAKTR